jgi:hypothetical protein
MNSSLDTGSLLCARRHVQLAGSKLGPANVHWIIRWQDKETRDKELTRVLRTPEWRDIVGRHPDTDGYLQRTSRFMEEH